MAVLNPRGGKTAKPEEIRRRFPPPFPPLSLPPPGIKMGISALNSSNFSPQFFLFINNPPPAKAKKAKLRLKEGGGRNGAPLRGGPTVPLYLGRGERKGLRDPPPDQHREVKWQIKGRGVSLFPPPSPPAPPIQVPQNTSVPPPKKPQSLPIQFPPPQTGIGKTGPNRTHRIAADNNHPN